MSRTILIAFALAAACGGSSTPPPANTYVATMTGANETPPTTSTGTGDATYTVNGTTVNYVINYTGLTGAPTGGHIHVGAAGVKGSIVVPFSGLPTTASGTFSGSFTATNVAAGTSGTTTINAGNLDDLIAAFKAGAAYTNLHTAANPGGEIRGQVVAK